MPDLESFVVGAKNQENLKSGIQRKKKRKVGLSDEEIEDETNLIKKQGTKSRPTAQYKDQSMNDFSNTN